jgi:hypothetical protein
MLERTRCLVAHSRDDRTTLRSRESRDSAEMKLPAHLTKRDAIGGSALTIVGRNSEQYGRRTRTFSEIAHELHKRKAESPNDVVAGSEQNQINRTTM